MNPINQIIRFIQLERAQDSLTEAGPLAVPIKIIDDRLERPQPDFKPAPLVAKNVSPSAHLRCPALRCLPEATRAGATQHQHAGNCELRSADWSLRGWSLDFDGWEGNFRVVCLLRDFAGSERRLQIIGRMTRTPGPHFGCRAADAVKIAFRSRACHADGNPGGR